MNNVFTAGDLVPLSGVYRVTHYPPHTGEEETTLTQGDSFPQCVHCSQVSFMLLNALSESDLLTYSQLLGTNNR